MELYCAFLCEISTCCFCPTACARGANYMWLCAVAFFMYMYVCMYCAGKHTVSWRLEFGVKFYVNEPKQYLKEDYSRCVCVCVCAGLMITAGHRTKSCQTLTNINVQPKSFGQKC